MSLPPSVRKPPFAMPDRRIFRLFQALGYRARIASVILVPHPKGKKEPLLCFWAASLSSTD
ncbi:uncharacterized protein BT62DRAFT_932475 [Guyanagaster necrorhizus]|uniref:Uncharacterized protein n=1 Tax=Guyanagaster necrorhizus TaxID=856835 RepID=A0A9P7VU50_9AGAR|nr:uncharacterized protein BT62DRAFT_932475 [Guyanagaster necrorhizus MCA 3950]KAG7446114.1 hypothetical protein BT62DRAFT_932475 [Guyanagaster necrorhizus MCA 3950]